MFWIGLATGLFLGTIFGVILCGIFIISKQADEKAERIQNVTRQ